MTKFKNIALLIPIFFMLSACTSQEKEWELFLSESVRTNDALVKRLQGQIDRGFVKNAILLEKYAIFLGNQKPELREITDALALDSTSSGPIYQSLKSRLAEAKTAALAAPNKGEAAVEVAWGELDLIREAASPVLYGMMLTDPINVLADMSEGTLGRVEAMSKEAAAKANGIGEEGAGSQLVGNPNYGNWRSNSNGSSLWVWYGQYALFSTLFRPPYYYGSWSSGRNYSYYNDYGRSHYTSPSQRQAQTKVNNTAKSKFQKSGKTFQSPYAKTKSGASRTVAKPRTKPSSTMFKSAYSKSSSARSSASRTSRGSSRGK